MHVLLKKRLLQDRVSLVNLDLMASDTNGSESI